MTQAHIKRVEAAIKELQQGKMLILTDHPDREDEGDLIFPAENVDAEKINFMIRNCSGIICLPMLGKQLNKLRLPYMVAPHEQTSPRGTPFTVSIEARAGVTTGVSASDRAHTILTAINDNATEYDLVKPGHIFPLHAKDNGVLARPGHTEGTVDIVRLAGFKPAGVLCEVMNPDGTMARGQQLEKFAKQHRLMILSIEDIIQYRLSTENLIEDETSAALPLEEYGLFKITIVKEKISGHEHVVLTNDKIKTNAPPLVRIHSSCITGDLFGSQRCDCNSQLNYALKRISVEGGMIIYLQQEGRGIGLFNKIKAYALQEGGLDTIEANQQLGLPSDSRSYAIAANILRNKNIEHIRLLTNNPSKINDLEKYGIAHVEREPLPVFCNEHNKNYLRAKKNKLAHAIILE